MENTVMMDKVVTDDICYLIKSFDFKVIEFGIIKTKSSVLAQKQLTHLYRVAYIEKGPLFYNFKDQRIIIRDKSLVYLPPETFLSKEGDGNEVSIWFISFQIGNLNLRQKFNTYMKDTFNKHFIIDKDGLCRIIFKDLLEEGMNKNIGYCIFIQSKFIELLVSMIRLSQNNYRMEIVENRNSSTLSLFNEAIGYINENIKNNLKVKDIADAVGISEVYLYKIFMKHSGKSPQQLLLSYRIQLAKNYLMDPNLSVKTIAYELGFLSSAYFSTAFKTEVGMTPKEYRKSEISKSDIEINNKIKE